MTAVYDAILEDILVPGQIIGKRTRIRLDGTQLLKVIVNEESKDVLEPRVNLICNLYKALTNRKLAVEFKREENYISVPKTKKIRKTNKRPRRTEKA